MAETKRKTPYDELLERYATAIHEAGHAVVCCAIDVPFTKVTVKPYTTDEGIHAAGGIIGPIKGTATDKAQALIAGAAAEAKFRGIKTEVLKTTTARFDTNLVHQVMKNVRAPSIETEEEITAETVSRNWPKIKLVASRLMEVGTLGYEDVKTIYHAPPEPRAPRFPTFKTGRGGGTGKRKEGFGFNTGMPNFDTFKSFGDVYNSIGLSNRKTARKKTTKKRRR